MNQLIKQDIEEFVRSFGLSAQLGHTIFLITGGTGLIGSTLIHCLSSVKQEYSYCRTCTLIKPKRKICMKARSILIYIL